VFPDPNATQPVQQMQQPPVQAAPAFAPVDPFAPASASPAGIFDNLGALEVTPQGAPVPQPMQQAPVQQAPPQFAPVPQMMEAPPVPGQPVYQGDGQNGQPPVVQAPAPPVAPQAPVQPVQVPAPVAEAQLPAPPVAPTPPVRPTRPVRPENFDEYEAANTPDSPSARYAAEERAFVSQFLDYQEQQEAFQQQHEQYRGHLQQYEGQMRQVVVQDVSRAFGMPPQEADAFYQWASSPAALGDLGAWVGAFRAHQQQAAQQAAPQFAAPQYAPAPNAQQAPVQAPMPGYPAPVQQYGYGQPQGQPFAQPVPQQLAPQQVPGYPTFAQPPVPQHPFAQGQAPYAQQAYGQPAPAFAFPPALGAQPGATGQPFAPEDAILNQMLQSQRPLGDF
jgi:hypothetical protein